MTMPTISVLVAARKNSKYLAKFLFGYFARTALVDQTEILVMGSSDDSWNEELRWHFEDRVKFYGENKGLGRAGLHVYLNELLEHAHGDWIIYFCEDHFITMPDWDMLVRKIIVDRGLDHREPWCIIPKFDNCGAMNQIVSRGWLNAVGDLGKHGWIDSYINDVNAQAFGDISGRVIRMDDELFHDFTHDDPSPMSDAHMQSITSEEGKKLPPYGDDLVKELVRQDADKLKAALARHGG